MRTFVGALACALVFAVGTVPSLAQASPPPVSPCGGGMHTCIVVDGNGNLWICGPSMCIPWDTSMPPLEP